MAVGVLHGASTDLHTAMVETMCLELQTVLLLLVGVEHARLVPGVRVVAVMALDPRGLTHGLLVVD